MHKSKIQSKSYMFTSSRSLRCDNSIYNNLVLKLDTVVPLVCGFLIMNNWLRLLNAQHQIRSGYWMKQSIGVERFGFDMFDLRVSAKNIANADAEKANSRNINKILKWFPLFKWFTCYNLLNWEKHGLSKYLGLSIHWVVF